MRVLTLTQQTLASHINKLADKIMTDFEPDIIIAIANGGVKIGESIALKSGCECISVRLSRSTTNHKSKFLAGIVRRLPRFVTDMIRMGESLVLSLIPARENLNDIKEVEKQLTAFQLDRHSKILIVDDAVDSGMTLKHVTQAVLSRVHDCTVRTAVMTITTASPAILPDYYLFNNKTLIRFPWSSDARED